MMVPLRKNDDEHKQDDIIIYIIIYNNSTQKAFCGLHISSIFALISSHINFII